MNNSSTAPSNPRRRLTRRQMLRGGISCLAAGSGVLGWAIVIEPRLLALSFHDLHVPNLPLAWRGKRLVHISDLHVGRVTLSYLIRAMETVEALEPDVLAITGDFVDHSTAAWNDLNEVLSVIDSSSALKVACVGNHDYGVGWSHTASADSVTTISQRYGIQVLRNEFVDIDGLRIVGLDDFWSPRFSPDPVLRESNPSQGAICLCHNPDVCDVADWRQFTGVILSGHTHGGQCKPPFLPPPILPVVNHRYSAGFFDVGPGRQLFITRGIGHSRRVRFNCRPEIAVMSLS
ncbi:MAG TPA: metallophosphoesterase [Pirellulaceae bacterium]|nr:metallophosphoesterase [Pirellulaceae bacterium]HMO94362.1 metallophosphoesterase [Pirellulaceae bacterium]HMP70390.1 metallophosphoesterase [Pirellulaceae bacterium]